MIIQKQEQKNFLFRLCIVDLDTIMEFSDKPNMSRQQKMDLIFILFLIFIFLLVYFSSFLFLELWG